jgi:hypothetical protein
VVLADGERIGETKIPRRSPQEKEGFFDVEYTVPAAAVAGKTKATVRFEGLAGSETGTAFGIRIVRKPGR